MSHIKLAPIHSFFAWARDRTFPSKETYEACIATWEARQPEIDALEQERDELVGALRELHAHGFSANRMQCIDMLLAKYSQPTTEPK